MVNDIYQKGLIKGGITETMYERLKEHHERLPNAPFYAVTYGIYSGDIRQAVELCLGNVEPRTDYVRCDSERACVLADLIYACNLLISS